MIAKMVAKIRNSYIKWRDKNCWPTDREERRKIKMCILSSSAPTKPDGKPWVIKMERFDSTKDRTKQGG